MGIVYKFLKAMDDKLGVNYADDYLDLVAVGNIADTMLLTELETRFYVKKGLENIKNPLLKKLIDKQSYSMKGKVNVLGISFYIAPLINSVCRIATIEEKKQTLRALTESDEKIYYKRKNTYEDIYSSTSRILINVKNKQNRLRDKSVEIIEKRIRDKGLDENTIMIINITNILESTLSGLVANQIAQKYKRPVLLIRKDKKQEGLYTGSARGYEKCIIKDLRQLLLDTQKFEFCEGHSNAHGFAIYADKLIEVNDILNEKFKNIDINDNAYEVDFIIPATHLSCEIFKSIYKLENEWCRGFEEPLLAIENINLNTDDIHIVGKNKNTVKFKYKNIEFIKFNTNENDCNEITKNKSLNFTVVGRCGLNEYMGTKTFQFIIEDYIMNKNESIIF